MSRNLQSLHFIHTVTRAVPLEFWSFHSADNKSCESSQTTSDRRHDHNRAESSSAGGGNCGSNISDKPSKVQTGRAKTESGRSVSRLLYQRTTSYQGEEIMGACGDHKKSEYYIRERSNMICVRCPLCQPWRYFCVGRVIRSFFGSFERGHIPSSASNLFLIT